MQRLAIDPWYTPFCELIWFRSLLQEMGFMMKKSLRLYCDNQAVVHIDNNPIYHEQAKHIDVDCRFIRGEVESKEMETLFIKSQDQLVDMFTQSLGRKKLVECCSKLESYGI